MSGETAVDEIMWEAVGPEARANWAVWEAAHDTKVLAGIEVIGEYEGRAKPKTLEIARDGLRIYVLKQYDSVPRERINDVLLAAEQIVKEERIANGEA